MKACVVHGFNVKDKGEATVDQLVPFLRDYGFDVDSDEADYGYFGLLDIRLRHGERRREVLYRMARAFESVNLIVTHSNGALFTNMALRMLPIEFRKKIVVVHISAAMNQKTEPAPAQKSEMNLCTPHDGWVKISSWIPWHPWGRRGARGYSGKSSIVSNEFHTIIRKHSEWFAPEFKGMTFDRVKNFWEKHT